MDIIAPGMQGINIFKCPSVPKEAAAAAGLPDGDYPHYGYNTYVGGRGAGEEALPQCPAKAVTIPRKSS